MWHRFWISILADATEETLKGVKVKIDGEWYRPVLNALDEIWYENASGKLYRPNYDGAGPITEIKLPIQASLEIGGSSGCGQ